ncbi:bifunctional glutamate N-acetyltransferase/amino-acid acetyltransferase ArgJ [Lichenicoccus sp.]|uniref:bifunctional glutamate N-acetyltransferase/amino-acid acetyltransferase ArgJ n=1 Tax=Lichenicoccus sp. TaxID=2781899 RepID=UPI003D0F7616
MQPMRGVRLATTAAGIRYRDRPDLLLAAFATGTRVAGVFTRNRCPGAPVDWCRAALAGGTARGLVVNAGNANVFTGQAGIAATSATAACASTLLGCLPSEVFLASTGVIGEVLPHEKITSALPDLHAALDEDGWGPAARAIMTTDTFPKGGVRTATLGGTTVRIQGVAKGSGMIAPDMATMLCFVATDAALPAALLQTLLADGVARSFNRTTVDSDSSTSDTVLLFATGAAGNTPVETAPALAEFAAALDAVLLELALLVVRDGEGASKLIQIDVRGAVSDESGRKVALSVANSPLVKTAIGGEDANWGRIVMAVGKSGEPADRDLLSVAIGGTWMARQGSVVPGYDEAPVVAHVKGREVEITIDLGLGDGASTAWTCDLTHGYIDINGSYRS